ncbi:MAG: HNH endonuclease [Sulfurovaceae bacterium]
MQTKLYLHDLKNIIDEQTYNNTYSFFSEYEEINGKPKDTLIYLDYISFDNVIRYFFEQLIEYLKSSGNYTAIQDHVNFTQCVEDFFVATAISSGDLSQSSRNIYNSIQLLNNVEFERLINEIKVVKLFFKDKYITKLFKKIRDKLGSKLQQENEIFLCPYCQRNYVNVVHKKSLTIKPDLDHFYPKAKYPFLAATIDNLIPACQVCNSRLKKEIDFYQIKHLHPLKPTENIFNKLNFLYLGNKNIYVQNKASFSDKEKQYIKTFRIEEVYSSHTEVLDDILEKNKKYNYVKKHHILKTCPSMGMRAIKELVFHEYINIDDKKIPMSSLKKSLFEKIVK